MKQPFLLIHSPKGIKEAKARLGKARKPVAQPKGRVTLKGPVVSPRAEFGVGSGGFAGGSVTTRAAAKPEPATKPAVRVTVGIWSLDAWLSGVDELIGKLNRGQSTFVFYEVDALVPAGLISRPERMLPWIAGILGEGNVTEKLKRVIQDNLIADDFFGLADDIRKDFGLDYLVGITPSMVAGEDEEADQPFWNYFSTSSGRTILASSYQLREFAQSSGFPFEAFLANLVVSQLLVAVEPKLNYHTDRGCLFDENVRRAALIDNVREPRIEPDCLKKIGPKYRDAAAALLELLRSMRSTKP